MLGGLYPLIVFTLKEDIPSLSDESPLIQKKSSISNIVKDIGLPIPIYLHNLTGIVVDEETRAIDIDTVPDTAYDKGSQTPKIIYDQRAVNSLTSINLIARKESVALTVLLALSEIIVSKIVTKRYSISYWNGPIFVMNGLLRSVNTSPSPDSTLVRVNIQISKGDDTSFEAEQTNKLRLARGITP